jgi:hypothetical protein
MRLSLSAAGALLGACLVAAPAPAAPLAGALSKNLSTQADGNSLLLQVQHRHHGGRYHGGGGGGNGGAIAAGAIGGLILGAVIASEVQRQQAISYCAQRYRSFDPNSMTYLGRNGQRYRCP